jgi:hypothetical protein
MKKLAALLIVVSGFFPSAGAAEERTPDIGMPFCLELDTLKEFLMAMTKKDNAWLKQLKGCAVLNGGLRIGIIEDYEGSALGHVVKLRVLEKDVGLVGYGVWFDLKK